MGKHGGGGRSNSVAERRGASATRASKESIHEKSARLQRNQGLPAEVQPNAAGRYGEDLTSTPERRAPTESFVAERTHGQDTGLTTGNTPGRQGATEYL